MLSKAFSRGLIGALLVSSGSLFAEGSRTLYPTDSGTCGTTNANLCRAELGNPNTPTATLWAGVAKDRQFFYVYANAGEYILVGSNARTFGGDITIYNPQNFGTQGNETIPGTASFTCSATATGQNFGGGTRGLISTRGNEKAGPTAANNATTTTNGTWSPCGYKAPSTGIYGVLFTAPTSTTGNIAIIGNTAATVIGRDANGVAAWEIQVRSDAASTTDINARVFTYAFAARTGATTSEPVNHTLYYATLDGSRYRQVATGWSPYQYALWANPGGFLDNGQPLYKDLRGTNDDVQISTWLGTPEITVQAPQEPIFISDISPGGANSAQAATVLTALGIPLAPTAPQVSNVSFSGLKSTGADGTTGVTYSGGGGTFTFDALNDQTYQIVIYQTAGASCAAAAYDPADTNNATLTGSAPTGTNSVVWNGLNNAGTAFPTGSNFCYQIIGRNGEIHFPMLDIDDNVYGGPTITKLNGDLSSTVYYDDRGYKTRNGTLVGALNGLLCGTGNAEPAPVPDHSLIGLDSSTAYRTWGVTAGISNTNGDCTSTNSFGDGKALDLWAYQQTTPITQTLTIVPQPPAQVATQVAVPPTANAGQTVNGTLTFQNASSATNATGVTYTAVIGTPGNCPTGFAIPTLPSPVTAFTYSATTCALTFTGFPTTLNFGQILAFNFSYTAPATGSVPVNTTINSTGPNTSSDSASGTTIIVHTTITIKKVTVVTGTVASSVFAFTGSNGIGSHNSTGITAAGTFTVGTFTLTTPGAATTISEAEPTTPTGWYLTAINCDNANGTATTTLNGSSGGNVVLDATATAGTAAGTNITCTFTNSQLTNPVTLGKSWVNGKNGEAVTLVIGGVGASGVVNGSSTVGDTTTLATATGAAGGAITLSETWAIPADANNYTAGYSCINQSTSAAIAVTVTAGTGTFTMPNPAVPVACTITNTRKSATLQLAKSWSNAISGNVASIGATTGLINNTTAFTSTAPTAANSGTAVTVFAGETATLPAESITIGTPSSYTTTLSCIGGTLTGTNGQAAGNTVAINAADSGAAIVCTYANARATATFQLRKTWTNAIAGNVASIGATTGLTNNTSAFAATAPTSANSGTAVTVFIGEMATLPAETMSPGTLVNYTTTLTCSGGTLVGSNGQAAGNTVTFTTADAGTAVFCTYANTRKSTTLTLQKTWVNGKVNDAVSIPATTGLTNNTTLLTSTSTGNNTTAGTAVTVFAGEAATLGNETFTTGAPGNYTSGLACTGGGTLAGNTLTVNTSGTPITCTYTNTRNSATLQIAKGWAANSISGNVASIGATSGLTNNTTAFTATAPTAGNSGAAVTVFAGETATLPAETMSPGTLTNYTTAVACAGGGTLTGTNGQATGNTVAVASADAGKAIVCTYTNTRKSATLTLQKTWVNGKVNDAVSIPATTGLTNNTTLLTSISTGNNTTAGTAVTVFAGDVATLGNETFTTGTPGNYTSGLACTGGGTLAGNTLTVNTSGTPITCTYTNTRNSATLTLQKTWVNGKSNDAVSIPATTGLTNNTTLLTSTSTGNNTTAGTAVTVFAGDVATLGNETFTTGTPGNYTSGLACTGGGTLAGNTLTVNTSGTPITCTYTNTRASATLTLQKTWVNGKTNDAVSIPATTGLTNNTTLLTSTSTGNNTTAGTAVTVFAGEAATLGNETFTTGAPGNYTSGLACTGGGTLTGNTLTVGTTGTAIVCTYTNTRNSATLQLAKGWAANSISGNVASIGATSGLTNNTTAFTATAPTAGNSGAAVTVFAGETATLPAETMSPGTLTNYTTAVACAGGGTLTGTNGQATGNTVAVATADAGKAIVCTYTNTRKSATLTLQKTWVNGKVNDAVSIPATTGLTNNTTLLTSISTGNNTTAGTAVTVFAGDVATLGNETFTTGTPGNYTSGLACTGGGTLAGNTLTVNTSGTPITCTYTNTRNSATMTLQKTWVNGKSNDAVSIPATTGLTNNTTLLTSTSTGNNTTAGTAVTVFAGDVATLGNETFTTGTPGNYTSGLACTGGGTLAGNTLTVNTSGTPITCTYTNTRNSATLTLQKTWVNGKTNDAVSIPATTGLTNNTTLLTSTSTGNNTTAGTAVTVFAGEVATLGNETFTTGTPGNYTSGLACTGGGTLAGNTLTVNTSGTPITCTYTNTRNSATLQIAKAWGANSISGNVASIGATSGLTNNTTAFTATAPTAGNSGAAVTVFAGETATLPAETMSPGTLTNYTTAVACAGGGTLTGTNGQATGNTVAVATADAGKAIVCTYTNTRKSATLTLQKTWVNGKVNDAVSIPATTGLTNNTTLLTSISTGNNTTAGTAVTVFAGDVATLGNETFTTGTPGNYTSGLACTGGGTLAGNTLTVNTSGTPITCTYTNTRNSATMTLNKTWSVNSIAGDQTTVTTSGFTNNASSGASTATTAGNTTAGAVSQTVFAGESGQIAETAFGNIGSYTQSFSCTNGVSVSPAGLVTISGADAGKTFACTETNTRNAVIATTKAFTAGPTATANPDQYTVTYKLTTTNSGGTATTYALTDTPHFGAGVTINSATCSATGAGADTTTCNGALTLTNGSATNVAVATTSIGASVSHVYTITATVTLAPGTVASGSSGSGCDTTTPGNTTNVGFNNTASTTPAVGSATTTNTCKPLPTNLTLTKVASAPTVTVGGAETYTLTLTNTGGTASGTTVRVDELVPTGVTINTATAGTGVSTVACGTPIVGDGATVKTCTLTLPAGGIAPGGTAVFTLNGTTNSAQASATNYAAANPADGNTAPPSSPGSGCSTTTTSCANAPVTINSPANVSTVKAFTAGPTATANPDQYTVTYKLTTTNSGGTATTYALTDTPHFGAGVTINSATCSATGTGADTTTCNGALTLTNGSATNIAIATTSIGAGVSQMYTITATVTLAPGTVASGSSGSGCDTTTPGNTTNVGFNNTASTTPAVGSATTTNTCKPLPTNLTLTKVASAPTVTVGGAETYTLTLTNTGGTASGTTVRVDELVPTGVTINTATAGTGVSTVACGTPIVGDGATVKTCTLTLPAGGIAPGGTAVFTLNGTTTSAQASATNYAAANPADGNTAPPSPPGSGCSTTTTSCANAPVTINTPASVTVAKTQTSPLAGTHVQPGDTIVYTFTATNSGGTAAPSYAFFEELPLNTSLAAVAAGTATPTLTGCAISDTGAKLCTVTLSSVPANGTATATISVHVNASLPASTTSIANVITDSTATPPTGCTTPGAACTTPPTTCTIGDTHCVQTSVAQADMQATGAVTQTVTVGTPVTVVTICKNVGADTAENATCAVTGSGAGVTLSGANTICSPTSPVATLGNGASITCTTTFTPPTIGTVNITTTTGSATPDSILTNNSAASVVNVGAITANPDSSTTAQNTPVTTAVVTNDTTTGAALNPGSVTVTTAATHGTVLCNNPTAGSCVYTPATNYAGPDGYGYQVCDTSNPTPVCASTTVTITVQPNVVTANPDTANTAQNTAVSTLVTGNDTVSATGAPLDLTSVTPTQPTNGTVSCDNAGNCVYTPATNFSGTDQYTYQVCDQSNPTPVCSSTTVNVTVGADTVEALPDTGTTPYATAVTTNVIANDSSTSAPLNASSVVVTTPATNGTVVCNSPTAGNCIYTPNTGFSGQDVYTYKVCDQSVPTPVCAQATVTIQVGPKANNDTNTTAQNTAVNGNVSTNDIDPSGSVFTTTSSPAHGTVMFNGDGTYTYTPAANYSGPDTFDYEVCEPVPNDTLCDTATVSITVNGNTPVANPDVTTTAYVTAVTTNVVANDVSVGAPLNPSSVTVTTNAANGTVVCNVPSAGNCTYTPNAGFSGSDSYGYQVCDESTPTPACASSTVTIQVGPKANDDTSSTAQNTPVNATVSTNDVYPLGSTFSKTTDPTHGSVTVNGDGSYTYTPDTNYSGTDTFTYTVCEAAPNNALCSTAMVTITIGADVVTANPDSSTTPQNTAVTTNVIANDSSTGAPLDPTSVTPTQPTNGTVLCNNPTAGSCVYTPNSNYAGPDQYTYQVCDTSNPTPVCATTTVSITVQPNVVTANPDVANTAQNTPVATNVIGNDTVNPTGAPLNPGSVTVAIPATHGTVVCNTPTPGSCVYTPNSNYSGPDSYGYQVCDTSTPTPVCATAPVTVTVGLNNVVAKPDSSTTAQNTPVSTNVVANDTTTGAPLNPGSVTVTTPATHGTVMCNNPTAGSCVYTPNPNYSGLDGYGYQVCDTSTPTPVCASSTVSITVLPNMVTANADTATTAQNTPVSTNVVANDTTTGAPLNPGSVTVVFPATHGTVICNNPMAGSCLYTPNPNYSGLDSYGYQVCDQSNPTPVCSTPAPVSITVQPNMVTANPDTATTAQNTPVTTNVIGNDSVTPGGAPLNPGSVTVTTPAGHGTVICNNPTTGSCVYTPNPNFSGTDTYQYQVCDMSNPVPVCSASTPVTITVQPNAVTANPDTAMTAQNTPVTTNVVGNDTVTPGGAPLNPGSVTVTTPAGHGTVMCNNPTAGSCVYTPNPSFSGTDTYQYQVCDTSNPTPVCSAPTPVTILVQPNMVTANPDTATTAQNTPVTTNVIGNDSVTPGGAPLNPGSVTVTTPAGHGTVMCNNPTAGSCVYTPNPGFSGTDTYQYQVCDTSNPTPVCATALVTVTVGTNNVTANPDTATTAQNTPVTTAVVTNDTTTGAALNPGSVTVTTAATHGTVLCNNPTAGSCVYTPATNYAGPDGYGYQVCDTSNPTPVCASTTVTITVQPNVVTANPDTANTAQNTAVSTLVTGNDTVSATGAPLDLTSVTPTQPTNGTVSCDNAGNCVYTPATNFSGTDQYTYQVCDQSNPTPVCSSTTVNVTVGADTVEALPDTGTTPYATAVTTNVIANDSSTSAPLNASSVVVTTPATNGTVVCNSPTAGNCIYTPNTGFSGQDVYTYKVCDQSVPTPVCAQATVTIQVGPKANNDTNTTAQNTAVNGNVSTNDIDPSGSVFTTTSSPAHGTVMFNGDGTYTYTPAANYSGPDTFDYEVCEPVPNDTLCDTATVSITVNGNTPVANPDVTTTAYVTAVTTNVVANDVSVGAPLNPSSVTVTTNAANGTVVCNVPSAGNCTYTPNAGFSGSDSYGYQVCDESTPTPACASSTVTIQVGPKANDDTSSTAQNTPVNGTVSTNDVYPLGSTFSKTTDPTHGSVTVNGDGSYTYTPDTNYSGTDTFTYTVCEAAPNNALCSTAMVTITIGADVVTANPDSSTTPQNTAVTTNVIANDSSTGAPLNPGSVTVTTPAAHGTAICDNTGKCTYTPNANFSGTDSYQYQVCDSSTPTAVCATATVTITVSPNAVTANPDMATTAQNTPVTTNVIGNDTVLPGGAPLDPTSVTVAVPATHGTATCGNTGGCTYTPNPGFSGSDTYTYQVCDTSNPTPVCATAVVTVTVGANNVTANPDSSTTAQNTPVSTNVVANDTTTGAPLNPGSVTETTPATHGTVICNNPTAGSCVYTPNANYSGSDSYGYQVCDTSTPTAVCATTTVTITISPNAVTANPDTATTAQNTPVTTNVVGNDTVTPGGAPLNPGSVTVTTPATHGTVICNNPAAGSCVYTPNPGFSGTDTYQYRVCDTSTPTPVCATALVTVTVGADSVTANPDSATTAQNTPVSTNVVANDTTTGAPLNPGSVTVTTPAGHGTVMCNNPTAGSCVYTPNPGFSGTDTYQYQVCDTSNPTPVCATALVTVTVGTNNVTANPDTATTAQNTPVTTAVVTNDTTTGAALNPGSVTVTTAATHGTVLCNNPTAGSCVYTPATNYAGPDGYGYQVCDTSNPTPVCASTTVTITVQPNVVTANPDTANTAQNTAVSTLVTGNDTVSATGAPLDLTSVTPTQPTNGTVSCDNAGNCVYTPATNFSGTDQYTYQVCDQSNPTPVCSSTTVNVTVGADTVEALPDTGTTPYATAVTTNVIANDSSSAAPINPASVVVTTQPAHGVATCAATGSCTYTPNAGFSGQDVYTYKVCDMSTPTPVCAQATVTIQVGPKANDDTNSTAQNTAVNGNVSTNDVDPSGSVFTTTTLPTNGSVTLNDDGTYTYTPNTSFSGTDTFGYTVCEPTPNQALCSTATVTVTVGSNTVTPQPDSSMTPFATPVTTDVVANDTTIAAPLNPASVTVTTAATNGTVVCNSPTAGNCTYTPNAGFSGVDTYTYQVCDTSTPTPACGTAVVTIGVGPKANADTNSTPQNTAVNGNASTNDVYPPGSTFSKTTDPTNGSVTVNSDGSYTYTPDTNFSGTDTFTYTVCEAAPNNALCSTATVTVTVGSNGVTATPDSSSTPQNTAVTTNVIANDSSTAAPLDPASVTVTTSPTHGAVVCNSPTAGSCVYTPATNYSGTDTYQYRVCDTSTPTPVCATTTVTITVQPNVVTANPDTANTPQNTPVATNVIGNDTVNPNGAPLDPASVIVTVSPAHGTTVCTAGSCTYTPSGGFTGTDTYTYKVCDMSTPTPVCSTATVQVTVGSNTVVANPDTGTTPYATPVTTNVIANDTSSAAPLNPSSVVVTGAPAHGTVVCNNPTAGSCVYTPNTNFSGQDVYTYKVCDTSTPTPVCAQTTVTIQVGPKANADTNTTPQGSPISGTVTTNDVYPPSSTFVLTTPAAHGTAVVNTDGSYTYTPSGSFNGTDTFTYTVCEPSPYQALCSTATVTVTVTPPNAFDPPFITKSVGVVDAHTLLWTIVVDNNANAVAQNTQVRDPLPSGMTFVSGQVTCTTFGTSAVSDCYYDAANNRIVADALLASDSGNPTPATAPNRLVITFKAQFTAAPIRVTNTAAACWDAQNNTTNIDQCTQSQTASAVFTPSALPDTTAIPVNSKWMLMLLGLLFVGIGAAGTRRRMPVHRKA